MKTPQGKSSPIAIPVDQTVVDKLWNGLSPATKSQLDKSVQTIIRSKEKGKKVVAVLGSGPNLHEGVTTLIAELVHKGIIDGVTTSSAVVSHEMAGTLERVKRVDGASLGFDRNKLPLDGFLEVSLLSRDRLNKIISEIGGDAGLYQRMIEASGHTIIKAAGNIAYPTGLHSERLAEKILLITKRLNVPFEQIAGLGADKRTMIGAGAELGIPVLVTVPQLVGGGKVGMAIGDSIPVSERSIRIAKLLDSADVIIESAVALTQEIHDGPLERYIGHGIWADWEGEWTYSLEGKKFIRIDLDPNLEVAWKHEKGRNGVSDAIQKGMPKSKVLKIPFRMEMSGFARLPESIPIVADIGDIWPILASRVAEALGITLDFMCYKQSLPPGLKAREWIVDNIKPFDWDEMISAVKEQFQTNNLDNLILKNDSR